MEDSKDKTLKSVVEEIKDAGEAAKVVTKLMKEKAEVEFCSNQDELDMISVDESRANESINELKDSTDDESKKRLETVSKILEKIQATKASLEKDKVKAQLVPLKYRDVRLVQTAVTEALTHASGMNFDLNTQILMIIQERKLMTIFLSLRKHDNVNERYFSSLEEIVKVSDKVIEYLYDTYTNEFEFTEVERKNS